MTAVRILAIILILSTTKGFAQKALRFAHVNNFSLAVHAGQLRYDPFVGAEINSPTFWQNHFRFSAKVSSCWLENYKVQTDHWIVFQNYQLGLRYQTEVRERARFYSEIGIAAADLNKKVSTRKISIGSYALAGLELFIENTESYNICYFFGTGYQHSKVNTNKVESNFRYASGFLFINGLRFYF